jgi:hypothetical protein
MSMNPIWLHLKWLGMVGGWWGRRNGEGGGREGGGLRWVPFFLGTLLLLHNKVQEKKLDSLFFIRT